MTSPLTRLQKDLLLEVIKNHLQSDMRRAIMRELPDAYNSWMGETIVTSQIHRTHVDLITVDITES